MLPLIKSKSRNTHECACMHIYIYIYKASLKTEFNGTFLWSGWEEKSLPYAKPCCSCLTHIIRILPLKSASLFHTLEAAVSDLFLNNYFCKNIREFEIINTLILKHLPLHKNKYITSRILWV